MMAIKQTKVNSFAGRQQGRSQRRQGTQVAMLLSVALAMGSGFVFSGTATANANATAEDDLLSILGSKDSGLGGLVDGKGSIQPALVPLHKLLIANKLTAEQNIFLQFVDSGDFEKALFQWPMAFEDTTFGKEPTGRALYAWLLFKNGIQVLALERLLGIEQPAQIASELKNLWKEAAPDTHPVWDNIGIAVATWNPIWGEVFGIGTEVRVRGRQVYGADQIETVKELIHKTQLETRERAWLEWQLVLALATGESSTQAAQVLANLIKVKNNPVGQDIMTMTAARLLYQNGYLAAAIKYYEKVPKSSDYWFDGQEEMAWSYIRKGQPQDAIALTTTFVNSSFASQVGPEPLFLRALAELKICDYPSVINTLNLFRERFKERVKLLSALKDKTDSPSVVNLLARLRAGSVTLKDLSADAGKLPRFVTRDQVLLQLVRSEQALELEGKKAGDLYSRSLLGGTGPVGFQARFEQFRQDVDGRVQAAHSATLTRVRVLAEEEVNEISGVLQKLHIVEAEVLQQVSLAERVIKATSTKIASEKKGATGSHGVDRIWFPAENETWFDEFANYRVDIKKGCESVVR
jgi:tetratricopeptide (TPR) repeat protein